MRLARREASDWAESSGGGGGGGSPFDPSLLDTMAGLQKRIADQGVFIFAISSTLASGF